MKILWLDLNSSYAHSSMALPALHAQVMERGDIEWAVVRQSLNAQRSTFNDGAGTAVDAIYAHRPDVVAATAWLFTHEQLLHIICRVKALLPNTVMILGGPEFLGDNKDYLLRHPEVNVVLRGEGEESFARWLDVWNEPDRWHDIDGLCYIHKGDYHDGKLARVMGFDQLKAPEESCLFTWDKPFVQLETTRGCFNTCAFCVSGMGDPMRTLSLDKIRQRLNRIRERGIRDVRILDRTFNYNPQHAISLLNLFEEYHPHLRFHLEIHPALLTSALRERLKTMPPGLLHLEAGIQSLRQDVLDESRRKGTLEQSLSGLRYLCSLSNLVCHADLIAGLPLYTLCQIYEDVRTLAELEAGEIQLESLKLLPGTEMRNKAQQLGIRYSPLPPYEVLATNHITSSELQEARRLSRLLDAYYNTEAWQLVTRRLITEKKDFLNLFLTFLTENNHIDQPMSLERRGELLYLFCKDHYPHHAVAVSEAWIEAGMSLRKLPAENVIGGKLQLPEQCTIVYGEYKESLRMYFLPEGAGSLGVQEFRSSGVQTKASDELSSQELKGVKGSQRPILSSANNSSTCQLVNSSTEGTNLSTAEIPFPSGGVRGRFLSAYGTFYGYETTGQHSRPVFKAVFNGNIL